MRTWRESADSIAMITVGSVRGNERLAIPLRVGQGGRLLIGWGAVLSAMDVVLLLLVLVFVDTTSVGGHVRFVPPWIESVGCPHEAQNGLREFQSTSARA